MVYLGNVCRQTTQRVEKNETMIKKVQGNLQQRQWIQDPQHWSHTSSASEERGMITNNNQNLDKVSRLQGPSVLHQHMRTVCHHETSEQNRQRMSFMEPETEERARRCQTHVIPWCQLYR